jgi:hypothetical protein
MFGNHGIDVRGFGGDTMHMARLWSAARIRGYSLEALSKDLTSSSKVMRRPCSFLSFGLGLVLVLIYCIRVAPIRVADSVDFADSDEATVWSKSAAQRRHTRQDCRASAHCRTAFERAFLSLAAILCLAPFMQCSAHITLIFADFYMATASSAKPTSQVSTRREWIDYSTLDAEATWLLRERLQKELSNMPWYDIYHFLLLLFFILFFQLIFRQPFIIHKLKGLHGK